VGWVGGEDGETDACEDGTNIGRVVTCVDGWLVGTGEGNGSEVGIPDRSDVELIVACTDGTPLRISAASMVGLLVGIIDGLFVCWNKGT
jgi:hypothetical protein